MRFDQLSSIRLFVRIIETGSFSRASSLSGISPSNATARIARLESHLGVKLLGRTTRSVAATEAGLRYYDVCKRLLNDLDEIDTDLKGSQQRLAGRVRVSINVSIARAIILPRLPELMRQYPDIHPEIILTDQRSDFVREEIDFAIRIGGLEDQDLHKRSLGFPLRINVASPEYLQHFGVPETPDALAGHRLIDFKLPLPGERLGWEFETNDVINTLWPDTVASVNDAEARVQLAIAGMGIVQSLHFIVSSALETGKLVRLFPDLETRAPEVTLLWPRNRHLPARTETVMRVFSQWVKEAVKAVPTQLV
ncbi:LysR family transcriptional regulator [Candidatus Pantoea multigeneris]|uniref:LysR family transcriptional regulator n=1 Tax=Candidatus Pantoea multigeneris TaxID=2608357 RepID=A0ABX0RFR0_9GAMM|nr:LysR family transcriptional regulator [Pantoea multigeneris]